MYDVTIVGAGITGCFIAHALSKYECKVLVIDKENDVANESTMSNSAIIHAGEDPADGTLKAKLNVMGNRMYQNICNELKVAYKRTSAFVVATNEEERQSLLALEKRAKAREIAYELLTGEEARNKEPNLADGVIAALELPTTAIVTPWEVANALAEESVINGVEVHLSEKVTGIEKIDKTENFEKEVSGFKVYTNQGVYETKYLLNAAGVFSDTISKMVLGKTPYTVHTRKGEYYVLDHVKNPLVGRVIYPAPSKVGKGILATPTIHGNVLIGPNANEIMEKEDYDCTREGLDFVKQSIQKTVKNVPYAEVIRNFAGLRASGNNGDFYIKEEEEAKGFIQIACIDSPGLSAAPAIAYMVTEELMNASGLWQKKTKWEHRRASIHLKEYSLEKRKELVKQDERFGRIICRCEQVTEGEIVDVINRPLGATTIKAVKKRIRPGMGRCQGGFCEPLIVKILARELKIDPMDVVYDSKDSKIFEEDLNV